MKTYEEILKSMLDNVSDELDKREGSIIYTALAPCAAVLAQMYVDMELERQLAFASTSSGDYLDMLVGEVAIARISAIKAQRKATFTDGSGIPFNIDLGSRFGIENISFKAISKIADGEFILECETDGEVGNILSVNLLPIDNISGLGTATLTNEFIVYGADEETDEALYNRYKLKVQEPITSGNANQYRHWAFEVAGVGSAKVFPLWNGAGTVKVVIADTEKKPAPLALCNDVYSHIENVRPIGATVTVVSATAKNITISVSITIASGFVLNGIKTAFEEVVNEYFKSIALDVSYISYPKIGALLLATDGVLDYTGLTINGGTTNISLADSDTPVLVSCEVN